MQRNYTECVTKSTQSKNGPETFLVPFGKVRPFPDSPFPLIYPEVTWPFDFD
jgi:hypothetical protein